MIFSCEEFHKEFSFLENGCNVFNRSDAKGMLPSFLQWPSFLFGGSSFHISNS